MATRDGTNMLRSSQVSGLLRYIADMLDSDNALPSSTNQYQAVLPSSHPLPKKIKTGHDCAGLNATIDMHNPFLIKVPKESWKGIGRTVQKELMSHGPFHKPRLIHMSGLFAVYQSTHRSMLSVIQTLAVPHGQYVTSAPGCRMPDVGLPVTTVVPSDSPFPKTIETFKFVKSRSVTSTEFPWDEIKNMLLCASDKAKQTMRVSTSLRQRVWKDAGYCGGRSYTRDPNNYCLSRPALLDGTKDPLMINVMILFSRLLLECCPDIWIERSHHRLEEYSKKIHEENIIEYCRVALTQHSAIGGCDGVGEDNLGHCHFHDDDLNDTQLCRVAILSKLVHDTDGNQFRISIIGATRKAIGDSEKRETCGIGPAVKFVYNQYTDTQPEQRFIDSLD